MATPDTTLRTALTKLADEWDNWPGGYGEELRALLATHPTSPAVDADVIRKFIVAEFEFDDEIATEQAQRLARALLAAHPASEPDAEMQTQARICPTCYDDHSARQRCTPAPVSDTRREGAERAVRQYMNDWCVDFEDVLNDPAVLDRHVADLTTAVLAALPAPPVVDEEAAVRALREYGWGGRSLALMSHEYREIVRLVLDAARAPVVDEAEIASVLDGVMGAHRAAVTDWSHDEDPTTARQPPAPPTSHDLAAAVAARLRGADRV